MLMTELANVRAQQALQQHGGGMHDRYDDEAPPPEYMSDSDVLGARVENEMQPDQSLRRNGSKRFG